MRASTSSRGIDRTDRPDGSQGLIGPTGPQAFRDSMDSRATGATAAQGSAGPRRRGLLGAAHARILVIGNVEFTVGGMTMTSDILFVSLAAQATAVLAGGGAEAPGRRSSTTCISARWWTRAPRRLLMACATRGARPHGHDHRLLAGHDDAFLVYELEDIQVTSFNNSPQGNSSVPWRRSRSTTARSR
jgi:hypothetical protein